MVSALNSGRSGLGLIPGQGNCVVFLSKLLNVYMYITPLHPGVTVYAGASDRLACYPERSRNKARDKHQPGGPPSHQISNSKHFFSRKSTLSCTKLTIVFHQVCKSVDGVIVYHCVAHFQVVGLSTGP